MSQLKIAAPKVAEKFDHDYRHDSFIGHPWGFILGFAYLYSYRDTFIDVTGSASSSESVWNTVASPYSSSGGHGGGFSSGGGGGCGGGGGGGAF